MFGEAVNGKPWSNACSCKLHAVEIDNSPADTVEYALRARWSSPCDQVLEERFAARQLSAARADVRPVAQPLCRTRRQHVSS